jgi:hypothetical protein
MSLIDHFRIANELHMFNGAEMNQQGVAAGLDLLVCPIFRRTSEAMFSHRVRISRLTPASLRSRGVFEMGQIKRFALPRRPIDSSEPIDSFLQLPGDYF